MIGLEMSKAGTDRTFRTIDVDTFDTDKYDDPDEADIPDRVLRRLASSNTSLEKLAPNSPAINQWFLDAREL